ncbi:hypothetical protein PENSPDRAFT_32777 [Peniophora sp. CONT]|nr:hypothetical protein PENSPDRAFT_32777 [Peniophora sp. CONT]
MMTRARKLRNRHTGGCSLPQEVLLAVFLFLRDDWPPTRSRNTETEGLKFTSGWMSITHICSRWREVALGSPSLWTKQHHILEIPALYIPTFVSRAKNCPQDLRVYHSNIQSKNTRREEDTRHILSWLCRPICVHCKHLRLEGVSESLLQRIFDQVVSFLPELESLVLKPAPSPSMQLELPARLASMHHITDLVLHGFHLPWDSPIFSSSLVHLNLDIPGDQLDSLRPTFAQFKVLFAGLLSLRSVILYDFFPSDCSDETITMPSGLESFELYTFYDNVAALDLEFLAHIRLPDACTRAAGLNHDLDDLLPDVNPTHLVDRCASTFMSFGASHAHQELVYAVNQIALFKTEHQMTIWPDGLEDIYHHSVLETPDVFRAQSARPYAYFSISEYDFTLSCASLNLLELRTITFARYACDTWDAEQWSRVVSSAPRVHRVDVFLGKHTFASSARGCTQRSLRSIPVTQDSGPAWSCRGRCQRRRTPGCSDCTHTSRSLSKE